MADKRADLEKRLRMLPLLRVRVQLARDPRNPLPRPPWADADEREVAELETALAALSEEDRELVRLRYFERQAWAEVAEALRISPRTVYHRRRRVLERLVQALEASCRR